MSATKEKLHDVIEQGMKQIVSEKLDFSTWRKNNTIMLVKGGWFGNQTPCYALDGQQKSDREWKLLYEQYLNK